MTRALVLGCSGAGKSTLARALSARLGLPLIHLDAEFWQPGWLEPAGSSGRPASRRSARWVMDGNYGGTLDARLAAGDAVFYLDVPTWLCFVGVSSRTLRYLGPPGRT